MRPLLLLKHLLELLLSFCQIWRIVNVRVAAKSFTLSQSCYTGGIEAISAATAAALLAAGYCYSGSVRARV